jgi:hypothetical protein
MRTPSRVSRARTRNFGLSELVRRGWTLASIAWILGAEDFCTPNGQFPGRHDQRWYRRARVEEAERGAEFRKVLDRRARRKLKLDSHAMGAIPIGKVLMHGDDSSDRGVLRKPRRIHRGSP